MGEGTVEITRRGVARVRRGHLWVYRSDVARTTDVSPGAVVKVVDGRGWFVGRAFYSQASEITLRMLTTEDVEVGEAFFAERLRAALEHRQRLFGEAPDAAMRLVHGEGDLLPGLVVDRYADVLVIQTTAQGSDRLKETFVSLLQDLCAPAAIVERNDAKVRSYEGLALNRGVLRGRVSGPIPWQEAGLTFYADVLEGQKTGAFLDQRENHPRVRGYVRPGARCLDAFSYLGGFALNMARAGGRVTAVEVAPQALAEARASAARNDLSVDFVEANAFDWLKEHAVEGDRFDMVVLDPPAFARSKKALEGARRGYKEINLRALQLLAPGGILVTCSCSYHVSEAMLLEIVREAASDAGRKVQLLERHGAGRDHPVLLGVPETAYLKCLILRRVD